MFNLRKYFILCLLFSCLSFSCYNFNRDQYITLKKSSWYKKFNGKIQRWKAITLKRSYKSMIFAIIAGKVKRIEHVFYYKKEFINIGLISKKILSSSSSNINLKDMDISMFRLRFDDEEIPEEGECWAFFIVSTREKNDWVVWYVKKIE